MLNSPVEIARALIGVPFRLHGRDPAHGLDCIGLTALAYGCTDVPTGYSLRGGDAGGVERTLRDIGFLRRRSAWRRGDLLMLRPGPAQIHLGVWTGNGLIHADAGLRRIVETPGIPRWPVLSAWLLSERKI